ncbi:hypothetical protein [Desulfosarcina ovata]|uniref:DUF4407 domain-containing protein n=1 Tax=Desulfosarcina ovata subsp. ovata TaxID=2752305 RepID=A0A5K8A487_9BACT|nr:hypothetical protein [Desulfosarcina ovata]BBO87228.1 hypothetical protein DSCOOX_04080 [Desulfosarcina ovata subsp. ovata]
MHISWFFKSSWILQLLVGVGLFLCSFYIEYKILQAFIAPPSMAFFLSLTLEIGKVTAIVWHYHMSHLSVSAYPGSVRLISLLFRLGLVFLSLICSQLFLNDRLDRPNLKNVKAVETAAIEKRLNDDLKILDDQHLSQKETMIARHQAEYADLKAATDRTITKLEALLLAEMDNVVGGVFKGPRYEEFKQRLDDEKIAGQAALEKLQQRQAREIGQLSLNSRRLRQETLSMADKKQRQIIADDFSNDERVNDPYIVALLKVTESLFAATLEPLQFVFLFSLLMSFLMEVGIVLAFSTITVSIAPVLKAQHESALEEEVLMTQMGGEARRDDMAHNAAMDKISKAGKRTMEKAEQSLHAL